MWEIRIFQIDLKKNKKNLDFYCFSSTRLFLSYQVFFEVSFELSCSTPLTLSNQQLKQLKQCGFSTLLDTECLGNVQLAPHSWGVGKNTTIFIKNSKTA